MLGRAKNMQERTAEFLVKKGFECLDRLAEKAAELEARVEKLEKPEPKWSDVAPHLQLKEWRTSPTKLGEPETNKQ